MRNLNCPKAFTLIELLICISIIAVLAVIAFPVFAKAKRSSQISKSISNLHQMHIAIKIYQADWDGEGKYGDLATMGLPDGLQLYRSKQLGLGREMWQSPCGQDPSWAPFPAVIQYDYNVEGDFDHLEAIAPLYQENLIVFSDMNCSEHGQPLFSEYLPHRGLGVLLSGALLNLYKPGDSRWQKWWSKPVASQ